MNEDQYSVWSFINYNNTCTNSEYDLDYYIFLQK